MISQHISKNNLHHAYLIEGVREKILPEIFKFVKDMEVIHINLDSFKIEDARNLKSYEFLKAADKKKAFIISVNNFLLEAQNTLLKMFEEPIQDTHFFVIVPDTGALLKTFVSRFYLIKSGRGEGEKEAEEFIKMPPLARIDFLKELLAELEEEDRAEDSPRSKALQFLNALEESLHKKFVSDAALFHQIFKAREFLRMPGSSAKMLLESVALFTPVLK